MKQELGTIEKIKSVLARWNISTNGMRSAIAMNDINKILNEDEAKERRLQTIAEDAKRDHELRGRIV